MNEFYEAVWIVDGHVYENEKNLILTIFDDLNSNGFITFEI